MVVVHYLFIDSMYSLGNKRLWNYLLYILLTFLIIYNHSFQYETPYSLDLINDLEHLVCNLTIISLFLWIYSLKPCKLYHFILQHKPTLTSNLLTSIVANFQSGSRSFYSWYKVIDTQCSQDFYEVVFTFAQK